MSEALGTAFRLSFPLLKAVPDADTGEIRHHGLISDESVDLQGDVVNQTVLEKSLGYLRRHGKFNWDHHKEDIGDVLDARRLTAAEAKEQFGVAVVKSATAVWGNVYPLVDAALASQDLKTAHHRLRAGARLGYSLDGVAVRKSNGEFSQMICHKVAIASQPVNPNTVCVVTKSLAAAAEHIGMSDVDLPEFMAELDRTPDILVAWDAPDGPRVDGAQVAISKALFGALVRAAFGPRKAPPLGGLSEALRRLAKS